MNLFTTDHPLESESVQLSKRARRWLVAAVLIYPAYLILLGPVWAIEGRGVLNFAPEKFRRAIYYPATPAMMIPGLNDLYESYLNFWYADPDAAETTR